MLMETKQDEMVVYLTGELDQHTAKEIREQLDEAITRTSPRSLRLDFSGVTFMDSSGIGLVMGRYRLMKSLGGRLVVCNLSDRVQQMMKLAGLDKLDIWDHN